MSANQIQRYRKLSKMCGVYPIACKMRNEGYSLQEALSVLAFGTK